MYTHHGLDHEFARGTRARVDFLVCAVPRSGSSLLCDALALTELAGAPAEYFDAETLARYAERWGVTSFDAYLRELRSRKTSPNGVFGFKAHYPQLASYFGARDVLREFPGLRCLYVRRADRVAQAVSLHRASHTDQWAAHQDAQRRAPHFDHAAVRALLTEIEAQEASWERFFVERAITPLRVDYGELETQLGSTLRRVLAFLDVDLPAHFVEPRPTLTRQADRWNARCVRRFQWVERYGADLAAAPFPVRWSERFERIRERWTANAGLEVTGFVDAARECAEGLRIEGWLLLDGEPVDALELVASTAAPALAVTVERADLARAFPGSVAARRAGWAAQVPLAARSAAGDWSFELRARRGAHVSFRCHVSASPALFGSLATSFPRALGPKELRLSCTRDGALAT